MRYDIDEGITSIAISKLNDLARSFIFKPVPLVSMHNPITGELVTFRIRRGLIWHTLFRYPKPNAIAKSASMVVLLTKLIKLIGVYAAKGYIEV